jgi:sugar lactone lactonase YvrE
MPATVAIGQTSFTTSGTGDTATTVSGPDDSAFDAVGDLWQVDRGNNRVLEFVPPLRTGMAASVVLGQTSLTSNAATTTQSGIDHPSGVAFDAAGDVWVADSLNDRVLEYVPPFHTGMDAHVVLGQTTFTTGAAATTASGMSFPFDLVFTSAGDLLVTELDNNRILEFVPPFTDGMNASVVLGQGSFTTATAGTTATALKEPVGLAVNASGELFVGDAGNARVLGFAPPFTTGMAASLVIGQTSFTTSTPGTTAVNLSAPTGVAIDARGNLWLTDSSNSRVLEFAPPFSDGMAASTVLGQSTFATSAPTLSSMGFSFPIGVVLDPHGNLWVSDQGYDRVLGFLPPGFSVQFVTAGLPWGTAWSVTFGGATLPTTTGSITVSETNGSYPFSAGSVGGYQETPGSGTVVVNGTGVTVVLDFTATILGMAPGTFWTLVTGVLAAVVVVDTALLVALLARRRRSGPKSPPIWSESGPPTPPSGGSPPSPPS